MNNVTKYMTALAIAAVMAAPYTYPALAQTEAAAQAQSSEEAMDASAGQELAQAQSSEEAMDASAGQDAAQAQDAQTSGVAALRDSGPGSEAAAAAEAAALEEEKAALQKSTRQSIINQALGCIGVRYVWGGESPVSGMDCSGFTRYVLRQVLGIELPHSAAGQSALGVRISRDELKPGDLVFYSFKGDGIDHVAMYLGDGQVIHNSFTRHKVVISSLDMGTTSPDAYVSLLGE